jgi:hypothetical protein
MRQYHGIDSGESSLKLEFIVWSNVCGVSGRLQTKLLLFCSVRLSFQYKKQQRELQFVFRREGKKFEAIPILTIDQCQGQEADIVIISLVQKPTRFLTKNRLNVALSRVRKKLFFLVDKREFMSASMNSRWECSLLAKDLLQLDAH